MAEQTRGVADTTEERIGKLAAYLSTGEPYGSELYHDLRQVGGLAAFEAQQRIDEGHVRHPHTYLERAYRFAMLRYLRKQRREAEHASLDEILESDPEWGPPDPVNVEAEALGNVERQQALKDANLTQRDADALTLAIMSEKPSDAQRKQLERARRKLRAVR